MAYPKRLESVHQFTVRLMHSDLEKVAKVCKIEDMKAITGNTIKRLVLQHVDRKLKRDERKAARGPAAGTKGVARG